MKYILALVLFCIGSFYSHAYVITAVDQKVKILTWKKKLSEQDLTFIKGVHETEKYKVIPLIGIHRLTQFSSLLENEERFSYKRLLEVLEAPTKILYDAKLFEFLKQKKSEENQDWINNMIRQIFVVRLCKSLRNGEPNIFQLPDEFYSNDYNKELVRYSLINNAKAVAELVDKLKFHLKYDEDNYRVTYILESYGSLSLEPTLQALESRQEWENKKPEFSKGAIQGFLSVLIFNYEHLSESDKARISRVLDSDFENRFIYDNRFPEDLFSEVNRLKGRILGKTEEEIDEDGRLFFKTTALEIKKRKNKELEIKRQKYMATFEKPKRN